MNRRQAWIDIVLALVLVGVSGVVVSLLSIFIGRQQIFLLLILQGFAVLVGLRFLLAMRGQGWRQIGLQAITSKDFSRVLIALFSCIGANIALTLIIASSNPQSLQNHMDQLQGIATLLNKKMSFIGIVTMMFFVGVYEEIMARGFLLSRCQTALGGKWAPILLSSFLFGLGHIYQGGVGVAQTTVFGIVLAALTLRWGTLWPAIFAHAILNTFSLAMLKKLAEQAQAPFGA